jgi:hypothetical protein
VFHAVEQGWTTADHLLANVIDALLIANWQRTEDATRRDPRNVPKRIPRPGDEPAPADEGVVSVGAGAVATVTTVGQFLDMRAEREKRWQQRNKQGR